MNPLNKYVLIIQGTHPIVLTEEERNYFLTNIQTSDFVQIRGYTLGKFFNSITPYEEYVENETYKARIKAGQWQCDYNNWHQRDEKCGHNLVMRGSTVYSDFLSLSDAIRLRLGEGVDLRRKLTESEGVNTEEVKTLALEEAESHGKDVDWYKGKILSNE